MTFEVGVVVPTFVGLVLLLAREAGDLSAKEIVQLAFWVAIIGLVELIPVPMWRGSHISLGFPLLMAVGFIYPPGPAAFVALLAASDPREFRREVSPLRALFNRSQVALSVLAASSTFHALVFSL